MASRCNGSDTTLPTFGTTSRGHDNRSKRQRTSNAQRSDLIRLARNFCATVVLAATASNPWNAPETNSSSHGTPAACSRRAYSSASSCKMSNVPTRSTLEPSPGGLSGARVRPTEGHRCRGRPPSPAGCWCCSEADGSACRGRARDRIHQDLRHHVDLGAITCSPPERKMMTPHPSLPSTYVTPVLLGRLEPLTA
jgi:hypothetical protein